MKNSLFFCIFIAWGASSFAQNLTITTEPQSQNVPLGGTTSFSVSVSGTGPFTYQWQFNGTNLPNGIIQTIAGNGSPGFWGDGGPATNASLNYTHGANDDGMGNVFIADYNNNRIRMVNKNGIISTVAGDSSQGFSGDGGQDTNAGLNSPTMTSPAFGNLYIDDYADNRIRQVNSNGIITTFAGTGTASFSGDGGPATSATLYSPGSIAVDSNGNVFIADWRNNRIRKVSTNGIITTVAGSGPTGVGVGSYSGDGGQATNATFSNPYMVTLDSNGNIFIGDNGNYVIRKVATNGVISTVAGNGNSGYSGDGGYATNANLNPAFGLAVDQVGNLYISDFSDNRIRKVGTNGIITTVVGTGAAGYSGDGGPATNAKLNGPNAISIRPNGNLLIADGNNRIREVAFAGLPTLSLSNVSPSSAGDYDVIVQSGSQVVTSSVAVLQIICPPASARAIETNGFVIGATVTSGGCRYTNAQLVVFQGGGGSGAAATAVVSNEVVDQVNITDPGLGYTSAPAIYIGYPPSIVTQPQSTNVSAYGMASFGVTAQTYGPTTYQWLFNGANISGATGTALVVSNVVQTNLGEYSVEISTPFGSITSPAAQLGMYPYIVTPFDGLDTDWGYTNTLTVVAWGTGPLAYQWFNNGAAIANATNQTLTLTNIQFTNGGLYTVVITNPLGSVTNMPAEVVVNPAGVSLRLSPTVVISGVVGYNYVIQRIADLSNTNSWVTVGSLTLTTPVQLWVDTNLDASLPANPQQFYQVLPGQ
jgi:hypothetical protein